MDLRQRRSSYDYISSSWALAWMIMMVMIVVRARNNYNSYCRQHFWNLLNMDLRQRRPSYDYISSFWPLAGMIIMIMIVVRARNNYYPPTSLARRVRVLLHFSYLISHISYLISHISYLTFSQSLTLISCISYLGRGVWGGDFRHPNQIVLNPALRSLCHTYLLTYYTYYTYFLMGFYHMLVWIHKCLSGALWSYIELSVEYRGVCSFLILTYSHIHMLTYSHIWYLLLSALSSLCHTYLLTILTILTILTYLLMGFIPHVRVHTQMPIWSYLELSGAVWSYLGLSGAIWSYLELSGAIWSHLELSGAIWSLWSYLEISIWSS